MMNILNIIKHLLCIVNIDFSMSFRAAKPQLVIFHYIAQLCSAGAMLRIFQVGELVLGLLVRLESQTETQSTRVGRRPHSWRLSY